MSLTLEKKLLLLNGSYNDIPLIQAAHRLGYYVITSGNNPSGSGHNYSDEYRCADYSDPEAIADLANELNIDAVCSASNDYTALSASYAAEMLGLPGHDSYETAKVFHEKDAFRTIAEQLHFNVPKSRVFRDMKDALEYATATRYPVMIKPVDLSGGMGVSLAHSREEAAAAIGVAFERSRAKRIVIEEYISGTQHGFICFIKNRKVVFDLSTNDYASPVNPWRVGMSVGHCAEGYGSVRSQIIKDVEALASACNAADGFLTIQYVMRGGKAHYLETMRRNLGNLHFLALSQETGTDWSEWYVANESGLSCDKYVESARVGDVSAGFIALFAPNNGVIKSIKLDPQLSAYAKKELWLHKEGDVITNYANEKIGIVIFACPNDKKDDVICHANDTIEIVSESREACG